VDTVNRFGFTTALYTSNNLLNIGDVPFNRVKSAKDTFSRYIVAKSGSYSLKPLVRYLWSIEEHGLNIKVGRFLLESMITSSNDSKMIPKHLRGFY